MCFSAELLFKHLASSMLFSMNSMGIYTFPTTCNSKLCYFPGILRALLLQYLHLEEVSLSFNFITEGTAAWTLLE